MPGSGKATVLQQGMLNNRIIICTHDDYVSGGLGIGVEGDAVGIAQEGSEHFEIIHCLDWAVYVLTVLRRWRVNYSFVDKENGDSKKLDKAYPKEGPFSNFIHKIMKLALTFSMILIFE